MSLVLGACAETSRDGLRVGTNLWLGYEPLYSARSLGYMDANKIRLVEYGSATQVMRGLIDGSIDAGALTLDEAILLQQHGAEVSVVLVFDYSYGADALVARSGIQDLSGLKGHRVGVETTALGSYIMYRAMERGNLRLSDLSIVPLESSQHENAFDTGKVDAVVTFDPVRSRLLAKGAVSLLDSSQLPGEVVDVLVVRKAIIQAQKENLAYLLKIWFQTLEHIAANNESVATKMSLRQQLSAKDVMSALTYIKFPLYKENRDLLQEQPSLLQKQAQRLSGIMHSSGILNDMGSMTGLFDAALLRELYP